MTESNTHRILSVVPLEAFRLKVGFSDGTGKVYDCGPLLSRQAFLPLKDESLFRSVKVDPGGFGISWNDDLDLSEYELWTNGKIAKEPA
jgi:hypothetical protein